MTKVELEVTLDADVHLLFEKGMRGRASYISKRYSKANSEYLKCYDPKEELKHIIYMVMGCLHFFQQADLNG